MDKPTQADTFPGRTVDGYRIEQLIGRGGMGVVYRATQLSLNRPVAIKLLPGDCVQQEQFLDRFHREVDVLSRLSHPNIVTVFERGEVDGRPYVAMEYVPGTSLREVMRKGPLEAEEALVIVRGVLAALEHAHKHGIIHRDIKPENILLAPGGIVKVADFGLSRLLAGDDATRLTRTHVALGTFEYMAPEQREAARDADERSDLFATGVVLYEAIAGELPIGHFEPLSQRGADSRLDEIVERSLHKSPEKRYQRAAQMGEAVSRLLTESPAAAEQASPPKRPRRVGRRDWHFGLGVTALWVFVVLAANGFSLARDEHIAWLVVGALASVWVLPRLRRWATPGGIAALGGLLLVGVLGLYPAVSGQQAGDAARAVAARARGALAERVKSAVAATSYGPIEFATGVAPPGLRIQLLYDPEIRTWLERSVELDDEFPRGVRIEEHNGALHLMVGSGFAPGGRAYARTLAAALGLAAERKSGGALKRKQRAATYLERRWESDPPPG